jgi:hypothetical protein
MTHKTLRNVYWATTVVFALWLLGDGVGGVLQVEAGRGVLMHLGYPMYLLVITGVAKILAAVAILQTKYRTIKEWAFAGYAIDCIGAAASRLAVGDGIALVIMPIVFCAIMFIPYYFWKQYRPNV